MKIMIDTNLVLDLLLKRKPFDEAAYKIFKLSEEEKIEAFIASFAITDIYYFLRKELSHEICIEAINTLMEIAKPVSIAKKDIEKALRFSEFNDLEDALQLQCAKKIKADYIVTRDERFLKLTNKAITPDEFLKLYEK
ncbi:putative toxin-antitoxin system toxin component, PIN family [Thermovenabulum gondwanense]|uniref:PIN domain-containing protein n=1 Tax=Thermovenabulum gondwanense TaxID=520767 RepID=A0A161PY41_9FIRM|nr:putative toxin-antitoxin system toxin component, PIN family [Thermovenabulum gondwanense]KYO66924.1 hypothetical protein ATZ99_07410 [Thermovenabulum gondwanense]